MFKAIFPKDVYQRFSLAKKLFKFCFLCSVSIDSYCSSYCFGKFNNWNRAYEFLVVSFKLVSWIYTAESENKEQYFAANMISYEVYLKHPFTMVISGPTGCGKTRFIKKLLENAKDVIKPAPEIVTYMYGEYQELFNEITGVNFVLGLDSVENIQAGPPHLIIIDDLMSEASNNEVISNLFTRGSHQRNFSVILLVQNFFAKGSQVCNITLNSHYVVLFKNPRDKTIASNIARQMYPNNIKGFQRAYEDATKMPYTYFFIDLKPNTPEEIRLMSNVFGESQYITVYKII